VVDPIGGGVLWWFLYQRYEKCCMPGSCIVGAAQEIFLILEVKGGWYRGFKVALLVGRAG